MNTFQITAPDGAVYEITGADEAGAMEALRKHLGQKQAAAPQSTAAGAFDAFTDGLAFGFGDNLTAAESAVLGRTPEGGWFDYSRPIGERYQTALDAERGQAATFREENPYIAAGANIAGAMAGGVGAAGAGATLMRGGLTTGQAVGRGALEGAAYGAAHGAGAADGENVADAALYGGVAGGVTGGALTGALRKVGDATAVRSAARSAPTTQQLKGMAGAAYDRARAANPQFPGFDDFAMQVYRTLPEEGFHPNLHPRLSQVLNRMEELSHGGTAPDFRSLEQFRRLAANAAQGATPDERRLSKMLIGALDNYMEQAGRGTGVAAAGQQAAPGAQAQAFDDVREGRALWSRAKKAEVIEDATLRAERRAASTGSGGNVNNAIRQNIRAILDNPRKRHGFKPAELQAMEDLVRGTPTQDALRLIGKLSPQGNGLMMALTGVGPAAAAGATGNPAFLAPAAAGYLAKALADRGTQASADALSAIVRNGGAPIARGAATPLLSEVQRAALARALAAEAGAVTGSAVGAR